MTRRTNETARAPVACALGVAELRTQGERWRHLYADAGLERVATGDGLQLHFRRDAPVERELRNLVAVDIECCPWAHWTIEAGPGVLTLETTSSGDGIPVIQSWFLDEEPVVPGSRC